MKSSVTVQMGPPKSLTEYRSAQHMKKLQMLRKKHQEEVDATIVGAQREVGILYVLTT